MMLSIIHYSTSFIRSDKSTPLLQHVSNLIFIRFTVFYQSEDVNDSELCL